MRSEDYPWLQALTAPRLLTANARRLAEEGVTPRAAERGVRTIVDALSAEGPLTRLQLRERLDAAGIRTEGQALIHLLMLSTLQGHTIRGPMVGKQHAYVLVGDWLPQSKPMDRDIALTELARRYLVGHAPAGERDLAKWAGLPLRDARAGLGAIAPKLKQRRDGLLQLKGQVLKAVVPPPRLLGSFDPLLLGWESRDPIVGAHKTLVTTNGLFRPFALVEGRAVAVWKFSDGRVSIEPFGRLTAGVRAALDADAADVERFMAGA